MLRIWEDIQGIGYYKLLNSNQTTTFDIYCNQHRRLEIPFGKILSLVNGKRINVYYINNDFYTDQLVKNL